MYNAQAAQVQIGKRYNLWGNYEGLDAGAELEKIFNAAGIPSAYILEQSRCFGTTKGSTRRRSPVIRAKPKAEP